MVISKLPAFRFFKRYRQWVTVIGLVAVAQFAVADISGSALSATILPGYDATGKFIPHKYIKRLRPADPESFEAMLAGRGMDSFDASIALS